MSHRLKFTFRKHAPPETWKRPGKPEWPHMLDIELSQRDALEVMQQLATQLQTSMPSGSVRLTWVGELLPNDDD